MSRTIPARRGPLVVALALASALSLSSVLAGCSGGSPSAPPPTTDHPGTPPPTTSPTPSVNPTNVAGQAAIAAVKNLYAEFDTMTKTGSSDAYRRSFTNACQACVTDAKFIDSLSRKKERLVGSGFSVADLMVVWNQPDLIIVQGTLAHTAFTVRSGDRVVDRIRPLARTSFTWDLRPRSGSWLVSAAEALK
jgi:hypothetical protein